MKKITTALMALMSLFIVTSCDNEEIPIDTTGSLHSISLTVNTQSMYDKADLTFAIREQFLRDGTCNIGVMSFLYDNNGKLIENKNEYLSNFNSTFIEFNNLEEGNEYTILTVETMTYPDLDNESFSWSVEEIESLSTIKIVNKSGTVNAPSLIGVDTQKVVLSENYTLTVVPEIIGSLVRFNPYNWDKTDFARVGWATKDVLSYYRLDPNLSRENRFVKDLTETGYSYPRRWINVGEDQSKYFEAYVLEAEIDWYFIYQTEELMSEGRYYIGNPQNEVLSDGETYQIGAYYKGNDSYEVYWGDLSGLEKWKNNLDNSLPSNPPTSTELFAMPYIDWSKGTVDAVKSYMSGFDLFEDITYDNTLGAYSLTYFDDLFNMYSYYFKTTTDGLTDVIIYMLDDGVSTLAKAREEVASQGFAFQSENGNNYYYTSLDTYVTIYQASTGMIMINYYDPKAYGEAPKRGEFSEATIARLPKICINRFSNSSLMSEKIFNRFSDLITTEDRMSLIK